MSRTRDDGRRSTNTNRIVRFDWACTPVGKTFVGVSDRGVCALTFGNLTTAEFHAALSRVGATVLRDRAAVAPALSEIDAYFGGRLEQFSAPVDLQGVPHFTRQVLTAARQIPFGELSSYGEIARRIDSPRSSRAVGGALGRNPVPIIVPCHRVIAWNGGLGGYTGGLDVKRTLLRLEGHGGVRAQNG